MVFCIISLSDYEAAAFSLSLACDSCSSCLQQPHAPALHAPGRDRAQEPGNGSREGRAQSRPSQRGLGLETPLAVQVHLKPNNSLQLADQYLPV